MQLHDGPFHFVQFPVSSTRYAGCPLADVMQQGSDLERSARIGGQARSRAIIRVNAETGANAAAFRTFDTHRVKYGTSCAARFESPASPPPSVRFTASFTARVSPPADAEVFRHQPDQIGRPDRFQQIIGGARPQGAPRHRQIACAGHENKGKLRRHGFDCAQSSRPFIPGMVTSERRRSTRLSEDASQRSAAAPFGKSHSRIRPSQGSRSGIRASRHRHPPRPRFSHPSRPSGIRSAVWERNFRGIPATARGAQEKRHAARIG